jgi:hypothetical protein
MRGDRVEVLVDTGDGTRTFEIVASRAGRRVEVSTARGGVIEVAEVTRTGQTVRTGRFMQSRVLAIVEHPALEPEDASPRGRGRRVSEDQASLLGPDAPGAGA